MPGKAEWMEFNDLATMRMKTVYMYTDIQAIVGWYWQFHPLTLKFRNKHPKANGKITGHLLFIFHFNLDFKKIQNHTYLKSDISWESYFFHIAINHLGYTGDVQNWWATSHKPDMLSNLFNFLFANKLKQAYSSNRLSPEFHLCINEMYLIYSCFCVCSYTNKIKFKHMHLVS